MLQDQERTYPGFGIYYNTRKHSSGMCTARFSSSGGLTPPPPDEDPLLPDVDPPRCNPPNDADPLHPHGQTGVKTLQTSFVGSKNEIKTYHVSSPCNICHTSIGGKQTIHGKTENVHSGTNHLNIKQIIQVNFYSVICDRTCGSWHQMSVEGYLPLQYLPPPHRDTVKGLTIG